MTIGERIKYYRNQKKITQTQLAELTGIHPVTIRKYEIDKTIPKYPQILRIAEAVGVSPFAVTGEITSAIRLETKGDLIGLMILLCKNGVIMVDGERAEDGTLKPETVSIKVNPLISQFFSANISEKKTNADIISYTLENDKILRDFLLWEKSENEYKKIAAELSGLQDKESVETLRQVEEQKEIIEMKLMHSNLLLDRSKGLAVKIPPDYLDE